MWEQLTAEQKQNYGEDYFERALRSLEKYTEKVMEPFPSSKNNNISKFELCHSTLNLLSPSLPCLHLGRRSGTDHPMLDRCFSTYVPTATLYSDFDQ